MKHTRTTAVLVGAVALCAALAPSAQAVIPAAEHQAAEQAPAAGGVATRADIPLVLITRVSRVERAAARAAREHPTHRLSRAHREARAALRALRASDETMSGSAPVGTCEGHLATAGSVFDAAAHTAMAGTLLRAAHQHRQLSPTAAGEARLARAARRAARVTGALQALGSTQMEAAVDQGAVPPALPSTTVDPLPVCTTPTGEWDPATYWTPEAIAGATGL